MTLSGIQINLLGHTRKDYGDTGVVAARAFQNDPFFEFMSPNAMLRARGLAIFCRAYVSVLGDAGHVLAARQPNGQLVGVAAWIKPDRFPLSATAQIRQLGAALWALSPRPKALLIGGQYLLAVEKAHPHEPLWFLQLLVVDPSVQRIGIGGMLQRPQLAQADEEGLPCYVETQNSDNLPYYGRFGYEVVKELRPVKGGPPVWTLRREPREPG